MKGDDFTEDKEIIDMYFARDEKAIEKTSEKYGRYCMDISMNIVNSTPDAEECVNDAYLKTWEAIPPQRPQSLKFFLAAIVRNISLNRYKSRHREKRNKDLEVIFDELNECGNAGDDNAWELEELIKNYLMQISSIDRAIFIRRYWYAESPSEISKKYGLSYSNTVTKLHRIREGLREYLERQGYNV